MYDFDRAYAQELDSYYDTQYATRRAQYLAEKNNSSVNEEYVKVRREMAMYNDYRGW